MAKKKKLQAIKNPPTIDQLLDNIDLSFPNYTPSEDALEFFALIRAMTGKDFEVPSPKFHYFIVDMLYGKVKRADFPYGYLNNKIPNRPDSIAIAASRGLAKSTVVSLWFPIVCAVKGETPVVGKFSHMLILSDTQEGGSKSQYETMMQFVESNAERFKLVFQEWKFSDYTAEFIRKGTGPIADRHFRVVFRGVQSSGLRSGSRNPVTGERFAIIVGDDIIARESDAKSPTILQKTKSAVFIDARNAMRSKKTQLVLINTLYTKDDPIYSMIESGAYTPLVVPICKDIHENMEEDEWQGAWPELHDFESVKRRYLEAVIGRYRRGFMQELMCRITDDEEQVVRINEIQWYDRYKLVKYFKYMNWYVTTDFTSSARVTKSNDYSAMALWAVDYRNKIYLVDIIVRKLEIRDQYAKLFEMIDKWVPYNMYVEIAVENNGNQRAHMVALLEKIEKDNKPWGLARQKGSKGFTSLLQGIDSRKMGKDKLDRFKLVAPMIRNGDILFPRDLKKEAEQALDSDPEDMAELLTEIKYTTTNGITSLHDDAIDAISQLVAVDIQPGAQYEEKEQLTVYKEKIVDPREAMMRMMWGKNAVENSNSDTSAYSAYT